jgi:hypothetical protein
MQAHLGTGVTSLYGLGHGSGNHAPTPAGFVDFIADTAGRVTHKPALFASQVMYSKFSDREPTRSLHLYTIVKHPNQEV